MHILWRDRPRFVDVHNNFIGSWTSREEGADRFREAIGAFESSGPEGRRIVGEYRDLRDNWLSRNPEVNEQPPANDPYKQEVRGEEEWVWLCEDCYETHLQDI